MENLIEKDTSALGSLFQQIIVDLKNGAPMWEDFVSKATKLHTCLRATLQAVGLYLEAFQKIADAATSSRGATKDIGTALTRICLRQRAVEARVKTFTSAIMECLVTPLQEKLEDWKKSVVSLDKEHSKETKRARSELKKRSTDTLRLQKKARKGLPNATSSTSLAAPSLTSLDCQQRLLQSGLQQLGECEGRAVRAALTEGRGRFCLFVALLRPVLEQEVAILWELSHVQEAIEQLDKVAGDPSSLPEATEQALLELTNATASQEAAWASATAAAGDRDTSPPSSMGSRKSSLGSATSLGSAQSLSSHSGGGGWPQRANTMSQLSRPPAWLRAVSQDSGFTSSQDRLFPLAFYQGTSSGGGGDGSNCSTPTTSGATEELTPGAPDSVAELGTSPNNQPGSWPNLQETLQFERAASAIMADQQHLQLGPNRRPHTISAAYAQQPSRPPLAAYHFSPPPSNPGPGATTDSTSPNQLGPGPVSSSYQVGQPGPRTPQLQNGPPVYARPSVPKRCSSLERPSVLAPKPLHVRPDPNMEAVTPVEEPVATPVYVNMHELASLAANKSSASDRSTAPSETKQGETEKDSSASESSLESSSGYGSQTIPLHATPEDAANNEVCMAQADQLCELPSSLMHRPPIHGASRTRPMSISGYPSHPHQNMRPGGTMSRRGSTSGPPPPPIRRTSSISTVNKSLPPPPDDLPPPPSPSFLQQQQETANRRVAETVHSLTQQSLLASRREQEELARGNVADTVRTLTELRHQPASPNLGRKLAEDPAYRSVAETVRNLTDLRHQPAWKPTDDLAHKNAVADAVRTLTERRHMPASPGLGRKSAEPEDSNKPCVADAVRSLTELRHQPASPNLPRRNSRSSSENLADEELYTRSPGAARKMYHDPRKLENFSPGTSRKVYGEPPLTTFKVSRKPEYEDPAKLRGSLLQAIKMSKLGKEKRHVRRYSEDYERREPQDPHQTILLQSLTARMSHIQTGNRAVRVRTIIASKTVRDPTICHESLMDQIRRGTRLRRTSCCDRSAPRIL